VRGLTGPIGVARRGSDGGTRLKSSRLGSDSFEDRDEERVVESIEDDAHPNWSRFGSSDAPARSTAETAALAIGLILTSGLPTDYSSASAPATDAQERLSEAIAKGQNG
jgi:hypothetical protein